MEQSRWVMETDRKLKAEVLSLDGLQRLLKQAVAMPQSRLVEVVGGKVRELLTQTQAWETEAQAALKARSVLHVALWSPFRPLVLPCPSPSLPPSLPPSFPPSLSLSPQPSPPCCSPRGLVGEG